MKRLNKKGFTLIELLAVIVILAIVVSITIPAITNTINSSKNNTMKVAVDAAQKWLEDQLVIYNTNAEIADTAFKAVEQTTGLNTGATFNSNNNSNVFKALEMETKDVTTIKITKVDESRYCVEITQIPTNSKYYNTTYWSNTGEPKRTSENEIVSGILNKSTHCS